MNLGQNVYKPISFWSWNGDMREDEIRWQIQEFKEQGFGGFFIHSRAGRLISYMGKEWIHACEVAIKEAEKLGMNAWLYDEDGWPSGFAGGLVNGCGEEYCAKALRFCVGIPKKSIGQVIAVYRKTSEGAYCRIQEEQGTDEDLYAYYQVIRHYVDIMDDRVVAKFIEVTHEEYKRHFGHYFGNVVKGIFTDEPQMPSGPCWSSRMRNKYREKYQEDILDKLWLMHVEGDGYQAFRYRFWCCANELINQNYTCQLNEWCNTNHLLLTGHFSAEDGLLDQTIANGGVMPMYANMGLPGIDHLGNRYAAAVLMKQITSVTHRRDLPYVLSEAFGCAGWDISFKELLGIAGWHAVFGVNTLCTHLSAYTITGRRKRDYPAFFSYQEPWWKDTHVLFDAIRKLNSAIGESKRVTKVAVLHPIRSVWCQSAFAHRYDKKALTAQFRQLVDYLLDIHIDFDLLDESELETAKVLEGKLQSGVIEYSYVIIPEANTLSAETVNMLLDFSQSGGKVMFVNDRPNSVEGDKHHPMVTRIKEIKATDIQNARHILQKYFRENPIQNDIRLFDLRMENEVTGIVSHYGKTRDGAVLYLFNRQVGHDTQLIIRHKGRCQIETISLVDNSKRDITFSSNGEYTYAPVKVESGSGVLVRISYTEDAIEGRNRVDFNNHIVAIDCVTRTEDNCLTLDMGRFKINDGEFSQRKAIIHMADEIYAQIANSECESKVCIEYTFEASFENLPNGMYLAAEKMDMLKIECNGNLVTEEVGWWIDKGIIKFDVSKMVINGTNTILLTYMIPSTGQVNNLKGKFESERNRFFYKIEPENVYICGDFDVKSLVKMMDHITYYSTEGSEPSQSSFVLVDASEKKFADITEQNMWFYRGNCSYSGRFEYDGEQDCYLSIEYLKCSLAKVYINNTYVGMIFSSGNEINITEYLTAGENSITIFAVGHNRNIFGPHHHARGALYFVGQHTFMGVYGFEDFVNPDVTEKSTWTDEYAFVPFGIQGIVIKTQKQ